MTAASLPLAAAPVAAAPSFRRALVGFVACTFGVTLTMVLLSVL